MIIQAIHRYKVTVKRPNGTIVSFVIRWHTPEDSILAKLNAISAIYTELASQRNISEIIEISEIL